MDWIWSNKEWLFSGVAVAIIAGVYRFIFRRRTTVFAAEANTSTIQAEAMIGSPVATGSNISQTVNLVMSAPPSPDPPSRQPPDGYSPKPKPREIFSHVSKLPLLQQGYAAAAYKGIKVWWSGDVYNIEPVQSYRNRIPPPGSTHYVVLRIDGEPSSLALVPVNIEQMPRLKVTHVGTRMEVCGAISDVGPMIQLAHATLTFLD